MLSLPLPSLLCGGDNRRHHNNEDKHHLTSKDIRRNGDPVVVVVVVLWNNFLPIAKIGSWHSQLGGKMQAVAKDKCGAEDGTEENQTAVRTHQTTIGTKKLGNGTTEANG